ncbi:MAG: ABC transporter permease [Saprospiraceae bacterium]|nr:MAG: ABC transporter permease [Saprospiraceae bacterium]
MLRNQFKLALRLLVKNKTYAVINLLGLAVGLACCLLIGAYIRHELSFDRYHPNADRIYRLANHVAGASYENGIAKVTAPWGAEAKRTIPEIEQMCRFVFFGQAVFKKEDQPVFERNGFYADASVFELFSWPLVSGDPLKALAEPNSIVLSQSIAQRYFGDADPVGQSLNINNEVFQVTGLMQDIPENSHFTFEYLVSLVSYHHPEMNDWVRWNQFYTYVLLQPSADPALVATKADLMLDEHLTAEQAEVITPFLQPLTSIHLHSNLHREIGANSNISYIYIFGSIALFILLIAGFNFVNLSTARAMHRAQEVGVRKVVGASRGILARQFLMESVLTCAIAMLVAGLLAELILPELNTFLGLSMSFDWTSDWALTGGVLLLTLLIGLLSGAYPAAVLSSFNTEKVLKGKFSFNGNPRIRQTIVVTQFTIATCLIIATLVVGKQLDYIRNKNLGFNKNQIVVMQLQGQENVQRLATIKEEIAQLPGVIKVSASANRPGGSDYGVPYEAVGLPSDQWPAMRCLVVDYDFLDTYEMEIVEGRGFDRSLATDTAAYLINEAAARQLGWENPTEHQLAMPAVERAPGPIVGVVKDFHFRSMEQEIAPLYIFIQPTWFSELSVKIAPDNVPETIARIEQKWAAFDPSRPISYRFFDQVYDNLYSTEEAVSSLITWFTLLAVFVTCLGLFGLSIFVAEQRTKEIGIRKVLGATVGSIIGLISRDFIKLVLIAIVVAAPVGWYFTNQWLQQFAYHSNISWQVFALAGGMAVGIAFLTVSYQSIKAALANPVESLRSE